MTSWQLQIREPSGETKMIYLKGCTTLGRSQESDVILKDPTLPSEAAVLWPSSLESHFPFWIRIPSPSPPARLADLWVREAQVPVGTPFQLGETFFQ